MTDSTQSVLQLFSSKYILEKTHNFFSAHQHASEYSAPENFKIEVSLNLGSSKSHSKSKVNR